MNRDIQVAGGDVDIGGSLIETAGNLTVSEGQINEGVSLDIPMYEAMFADLAAKSEYWATSLPANGVIEGELTFRAGDDECLQVFWFDPSEWDPGYVVDVLIDSSLEDKTILINVAADDETTIDFFGDFKFNGLGGFMFPSKIKASILWNFFSASLVTLTGSGAPEMPGTILIPNGSLNFEWSGHSGRLIVGKDLVQNKAGSEFHK